MTPLQLQLIVQHAVGIATRTPALGNDIEGMAILLAGGAPLPSSKEPSATISVNIDFSSGVCCEFQYLTAKNHEDFDPQLIFMSTTDPTDQDLPF